MKNDKKMFITIEAVLMFLVMILAAVMLKEKDGNERRKVSVILQNSEDEQWAAFKYGLKMAAEDQKVNLAVVSTERILTVEDEKNLIENELKSGANAVILQPVPGEASEAMLEKMQKKIPIIFVEYSTSYPADSFGIRVVETDHYAMGAALAQELLKDYNTRLSGKKIGMIMENEETEAARRRKQGFRDTLKGTGIAVSWFLTDFREESGENALAQQSKVDFVIALDDSSLRAAGACAAERNLHGAIIYGIGNSTEAVYYLDTGFVKCLAVPEEFDIGYQSLTIASERMKKPLSRIRNRTVSYTLIRREALFSRKNQEILFTMSQ